LSEDCENGTLVAVEFVNEAKFPKDLAKVTPLTGKRRSLK